MAKAIVGATSGLLTALRAAGIVDDPAMVRRVVIDIKAGHVPTVYVERYGDEQLVKVIEALSTVEVVKD